MARIALRPPGSSRALPYFFAALDSQAATPLLKQAQEAGIPVIAFDSGVDSDIPVTTVTTDITTSVERMA